MEDTFMFIFDPKNKKECSFSLYSDIIRLPAYADRDEKTFSILKMEAVFMKNEYERLVHESLSRCEKPVIKVIKAAARNAAREKTIRTFSIVEYNNAHNQKEDMVVNTHPLHNKVQLHNGRVIDDPVKRRIVLEDLDLPDFDI